MITQSEDSLDTQAFTRIKADLLASPKPEAANETPRATRVIASAARSQTRLDGNPLDSQALTSSNLSVQPCGKPRPSSRRTSGRLPYPEIPSHVTSRRRSAVSVYNANTTNEFVAASLEFNAAQPSHRPKRSAMDGSERENGPVLSNGLNDTQELPSQVYANYFNPKNRPASQPEPSNHSIAAPSSLGSNDGTCAAVEIGHVNHDADGETYEQDLHRVNTIRSDQGLPHQSPESQYDNDDNESVTSPVAPSPITPAVTGQKRDREGNHVEFQPQSHRGDDGSSQNIVSIFKMPQVQDGLGLSQVFKQTQAATSPLLEETRSDPIFERPSPDFRGAQRVSSPTITSPDTVRKGFSEKTTQGPKDIYISVRQSQEKRQQGQQTKTTLSQDSDDGFGYFDQDSVEHRLARRRRKAEIEASSKRDFATFGTPSSPKQTPSEPSKNRSSNSLVTPAMRRMGKGIVETLGDTPLSAVIEAEDEDGHNSDDVSMDEYDELSQTVISTNRRKENRTEERGLANSSTSSPLPEADKTVNRAGTQYSTYAGTSIHLTSDTQRHENDGLSNHLLSQSVKVADSQPDRTHKQDYRGTPHQDRDVLSSASADPRQIIPQSQGVGLQAAAESRMPSRSEIPESSSIVAQAKDQATTHRQHGAITISESPASSPPLDRKSAVLGNTDSELIGNSKPTRQKLKDQISPPPPRRKRPLRTIPDTSPSTTPRSGSRQEIIDNKLEVPSASLPTTRTSRHKIRRSLARSHSTSTYETAMTHQPLSSSKTPLKAQKNDENAPGYLEGDQYELPNEEHGHSDPPDGGGTTSNVLADVDPHLQAVSIASSQENRPPKTRTSRSKSRHQQPSNAITHHTTTLAPSAPSIRPISSATRPEASETGNWLIDQSRQQSEANQIPGGCDINEPTESHAASLARAFPNRVFARFKDPKMLYYPATCLGLATDSTLEICFDDGIVDDDIPLHLVKSLELRAGDTVKVDQPDMRKNEYLVRGFSDRVTNNLTEPENSYTTDVFGHTKILIELKRRISFSTEAAANPPETLQVSLGEVYLTQQLFARLEGRNAPDMNAANLDQRLHTPVDGCSRPATPSSRHKRQTAHITKRPALHESRSVLGSRIGLFSNMIFAITHVLDKDFDEKKVLSEKSFTSKLITENGGHLLSGGFEELFETCSEDDNVQDPGTKNERGLKLIAKYSDFGFSALITNSHSRSPKFIQALALNIPCLSTRWIIDSVNSKTILPWSYYLLPAGRSKLLGDAVRSRTFPEYGKPMFDASSNQISEMLGHRLNLLDGVGVIMIIGKTKAEQDRRQPYVFLSHALGADRVKRVKDIGTARDLISKDPTTWALLGVDEDSIERAKSELQTTNFEKSSAVEKGSKRRKRAKESSNAKTEELGDTLPIRIVGTEYLVQSLIVGRLVD